MIPELLAIDLDGTLLPATKELTARAISAVRAAADAGVHVVLATGKAFHLTERYAVELGPVEPIIALDGGLVRSGPGLVSETLARVTVPIGSAAEALECLSGLDLLPFLTDGADRLVVDERLADLGWFLRVYATEIDLAPEPLAEADGDPFFLALIGPPAVVSEGEKTLADLAANGLSVFSAQFLDKDFGILVVRPRTDKGAGLRSVSAHLGIDRSRVAAIGDWRNDTAMIEWAGTGVAMPRSSPDVLAAADLILPDGPEDDGVAKYIEELLGK